MKKALKILFLVMILLFIMNCYSLFEIKNIKKENFADTSNIDLIKKEISKIYQTDIDAIRNLSVISQKLQTGGKNGTLTIPGNVKIEGKLEVDKSASLKNNLNVIGNINANKNIIASNNLNINGELIVAKNIITNGKLDVNGDVTSKGNGYFGPAYIGKYGKSRSDYAQFSHINSTGGRQYSILQHKSGETYVNAGNSRVINFKVNDSEIMKMDSANLNIKGKKAVTEGKLMKITNPNYGNLGTCGYGSCGGSKFVAYSKPGWNDNTTRWKLSAV